MNRIAFVLALLASTTLNAADDIPLSGVEGRIDHLGIDLVNQRLFVAALGNDTLEVIDLKSGQRSRSLKGFAKPQGVQYVPAANRLYVSNGKANRVDTLDGTSLARIKSIDGLEDADNIRYDVAAQKLYVAHEAGFRVLDALSGESVGDIAVPGHPESFQLEKSGPRIFANLPSRKNITVVDRVKGSVIATWELDGASGNYPMALGEEQRRLFVGTRNPAALLIYDTDTGKVIGRHAVGGDTDDLFFDAESKRIYVICGEGVVNVLRQEDANRYAMDSTVKTRAGARTGLFVPELRTLFVAARAADASLATIKVMPLR